jgi:hypothetical protein
MASIMKLSSTAIAVLLVSGPTFAQTARPVQDGSNRRRPQGQ